MDYTLESELPDTSMIDVRPKGPNKQVPTETLQLLYSNPAKCKRTL